MGQSKLSYITSRDNPLLVRLRKLARHPGDYRKLGQVLLEGEHLCQAWLARGRPVPLQALITESAWEQGHVSGLAESAMATVIVGDEAMLEVGTLETPSPIAFVVELGRAPRLQPDAPTVVLDRVQDAGNVGSILRSAAAFGFAQVVALEGTASLWSPKVLRAGMGAHFGLALLESQNDDALAALQVPLLGTSSHAAVTIADAGLPWPCAWVLGNEGAGASEAVQARCAQVLRIPQPGGEESLNVAAAAAVCLYESSRGRTPGGR